MKTIEAIAYERKKEVSENLRRDPHYYDELVSSYMACRKCGGTGEIRPHADVGEWESEGGAIGRVIQCSCGGERVKITEDTIKRFFDLPMPTRDITIRMRRSGAVGFDVSLYVQLNPALQDEAMGQLDALLFNEKNLQWLMGIYPWAISYESGVSYRHFSGDSKEAQSLLQKWIKNCQQKFGKNLTVESLMQN